MKKIKSAWKFLSRYILSPSQVILLTVAILCFADIFWSTAVLLMLALLGLPKAKKITGLDFRKNILLPVLPVAIYVNPINHDHPLMYICIFLSIVLGVLTILNKRAYDSIKPRDIIVSKLDRQDSTSLTAKSLVFAEYILTVSASIFLIHSSAIAIAMFVVVVIGNLLKIIKNTKGQDSSLYDEKSLAYIEKYKPKFVIFFSLGKRENGVYMMWHEYFERVGEPFIVVTPQIKHLETIGSTINAPVVFCRNTRSLERILGVNSVKAVFYPTNSYHNMSAMTVTQPHHVHIGHGDSDKGTSFRSVTAMYDKIFVAGQEAIDRYANNGVFIPKQKFKIVGRPQVELVKAGVNKKVKSVLYAPTWHGDIEAFDYTSLYKGRTIVKALLDSNIRVIFRPHPNSALSPVLKEEIREINELLENSSSRTGVEHIYGGASQVDMSIYDCFNISDAMISDVSSVISDYLYANKPIVLISMKDNKDDFIKRYPVSRAAYVFDDSLDGYPQLIKELASGNDEMKRVRSMYRDRYLSRPKKGKEYADLFCDAVKDVIKEPNPRNLTN